MAYVEDYFDCLYFHSLILLVSENAEEHSNTKNIGEYKSKAAKNGDVLIERREFYSNENGRINAIRL